MILGLVYNETSCISGKFKGPHLMRVQYSHHIFSTQDVGGISNYFLDLAHEMSVRGVLTEMRFPLAITRSLHHFESFKGKVVPKDMVRRGITWRLVHAANTLSEFTEGQFSRLREQPDIFHRTYYSNFGNYRNAPEVLTVYDMIHEDFPNFFRKPILKDKIQAIHKAKEVICISEYTRGRLINYTDIDPAKISVVPLGIVHGDLPRNKLRPQGDRPYILYIGSRNSYKNFKILALAFSELNRIHKDLSLVIVGGGPMSELEQKEFHILGITKNIRLANHDSHIGKLVGGAQCVISTSIAEGFGLVPLESLSQGTPCIVSDIEVNREIWGETLPRFSYNNQEQLVAEIQHLLDSDQHWTRISQNGSAVARTYNVQRMANATLAVYHRAAAQ